MGDKCERGIFSCSGAGEFLEMCFYLSPILHNFHLCVKKTEKQTDKQFKLICYIRKKKKEKEKRENRKKEKEKKRKRGKGKGRENGKAKSEK